MVVVVLLGGLKIQAIRNDTSCRVGMEGFIEWEEKMIGKEGEIRGKGERGRDSALK